MFSRHTIMPCRRGTASTVTVIACSFVSARKCVWRFEMMGCARGDRDFQQPIRQRGLRYGICGPERQGRRPPAAAGGLPLVSKVKSTEPPRLLAENENASLAGKADFHYLSGCGDHHGVIHGFGAA